MKIKLSITDADECPFKFRIGDKVSIKTGGDVGEIVSGDCYYFESIPNYNKICYEIRLRNGGIRIMSQSDLDLVS
jgi:hypothetical protein